jgi:hypothetical protein
MHYTGSKPNKPSKSSLTSRDWRSSLSVAPVTLDS